MLTKDERRARARIAAGVRWGIDAAPDRAAFLKLQATRQLDSIARRLTESRAAAGLPDHVSDAAVLAKVASLLLGAPESKVPV